MAEQYSIRTDYAGGTTLVYYGQAIPGSLTSDPKWSIMKQTYDGSNNLLTSLWAGGTSAATSIWDNRAALVYS